MGQLITASSRQGVVATVYAVRAIVCTGLLLLLMIRAELRHRRGANPPLC